MSFYSVMYKIFVKGVRWFYRMEIIGSENEPEEGGCLVCANHMSAHDVVILAGSLKRQVRFFAKAELFRIPGLKQLITALGAYPINRGKSDVGAIKKTIALLEGGELVGLYPQGTRCPGVHPSETKPRNGVGLITFRSKVKVLPVAITTKDFIVKPFKKTYIRIGKPIEYEDLGFINGTKDEFEVISRKVFDQIVELVDEQGGY
nr:1-acyl-sn-glycerol-3-phosphate acyltransferase [Clostridia bacterium]